MNFSRISGESRPERRRLHVVDEVVDDRVVADLDALLVRRLARRRVGADVEADDRRARGLGQRHVRLGDGAHARVQHADAHLVGRELLQRLHDRLGRALHVGLDHDGQLLDVLVGLGLGEELVERRRRAHRRAPVAGEPLAVAGDLARLGLVVDDVEDVARLGRAAEAEHLDRDRRPGLLHALALVVEERAHPAPLLADDEDVAALQRALLHQHRRHRAAADVELGLDHRALGLAVGVGLEVEHLGLQRDVLEQRVEPLAGQRRDLDVEHLAAHLLDHHLVVEELGAHPVRVGAVLVDLVDRHDHRHARRLGVADRLDRLRHDAVVGGDHQHHDVGHLRAAGAHGGEGGVARGVEEGDRARRSSVVTW